MEDEIFYIVSELLKNAFLHGNRLESELPIYFYLDIDDNSLKGIHVSIMPVIGLYLMLNMFLRLMI